MAVREGLLALLADESRYGYQLKTAFEAATGGVWALNVGQVYTTLDRLQRDGLVDVDEANGQKRYTLTSSGREALGGWWKAVPLDDPPPRDELQLKMLLAIDHGPEHALRVITHQRTELTRLLQQHRRSSRSREAPDRPAARRWRRCSSQTRWRCGPKPTCAGSTFAKHGYCGPLPSGSLPPTEAPRGDHRDQRPLPGPALELVDVVKRFGSRCDRGACPH